jgi:hypothetical protein
MELSKEFKIDEETYVEFCVKTANSRNYATVTITSLFIVAMSAILKFSSDLLSSILFGLVYGAIYIAIVLIFSKITTKKAAQKAYLKRGIDKYEMSVLFNSEGISQKFGEDQETKIEWERFKKILETNIAYYFYINASQAILVSKKFLESGEQSLLKKIIVENATPKCKIKFLKEENVTPKDDLKDLK